MSEPKPRCLPETPLVGRIEGFCTHLYVWEGLPGEEKGWGLTGGSRETTKEPNLTSSRGSRLQHETPAGEGILRAKQP